MATSLYNYLTVLGLEKHMATDFFGTGSKYKDADGVDKFDEDNVLSWISQAERLVVGYMFKSYDTLTPAPAADEAAIDAIVPPNVRTVVIDLAEIIAVNKLIRFKFIVEEKQRVILDSNMLALLDAQLKADRLNASKTEVQSVEDFSTSPTRF